MRRWVGLLLFICFSILHAEALTVIEKRPVQMDDFTINYLIDHNATLTLEKVKDSEFKEGPNRLSLGINAHTTWYKIVVCNATQSALSVYLQDEYVFHSSRTAFYLFSKSGELERSIVYEPRKKVNVDKLDGAVASFLIDLKPEETKTVYVQSQFLAYQLVHFKLNDTEHAVRSLVESFFWIVVLSSVLMTLAIYYLLLFFVSKYRDYLYYSLYLIASTVFISYSYGMVTHYFHIFGKVTLYLNAMIILAPVFLALFVKSVFNTAQKHKVENVLLNSLIVIFGGVYLYSFYDYYQAIEWTSFIYIYQLVVMLAVAISLYVKKEKLIVFFLYAHLSNIVFSIVALLYYHNMIPWTFVTSHAVAIGTAVEALLLGALVSYRIKLLEEENLRKDAILRTDMMTSLYNRSYFEEELQRQIVLHRKQKQTLGLLVIDIDYFKQYNDTYGHSAGDSVLGMVAVVLKEVLQNDQDKAFRIGGEEFAVLCTNTSRKKLEACAMKIMERISTLKITHEKSGVLPWLSVSIGGFYTDKVVLKSALQVYQLADKALYRAKEEGRNRVVILDVDEGVNT